MVGAVTARRVVVAVAGSLVLVALLMQVASPAVAQGEFTEDYLAPEVTVWIHGSGGDAIDAWIPATESTLNRGGLMLEVASALGGAGLSPSVRQNDFYLEDLSVQLDGRLSERDGSNLRFHFNGAALTSIFGSRGFSAYWFAYCAPDIGVDLQARVPDETSWADDVPDFECGAWYVDAENPLTVDLVLGGTSEDYVRLTVVLAGLSVFGALLAFCLALLLRRSLVRTAGTASFVLLAVGLGFAMLAPAVAGIVVSVMNATVTSHAIAADLSRAGQVIATAVPVLALALPGTAFAFAMAAVPMKPWQPPPPVPPRYPGYPGYPPQQPPPMPPPVQPVARRGESPGLPSWLDER